MPDEPLNHEALVKEIEALVKEARDSRSRVLEYENAITWDTNCLNCSKLLDANYKLYAYSEQLRQVVDKIRDWATTIHGGTKSPADVVPGLKQIVDDAAKLQKPS